MSLIVIAAAAAIAALYVPAVQDALLWTMASRSLERRRLGNTRLLRSDALRAVVCGSSSPMPDPRRAKTCIAVIAGGKLYIVDVGPNSAGAIGLPTDRLSAVFLTHFHSDHIGDLGELNNNSWGMGRTAPLDIYGPPGIERVVAGFSEAYALDQEYRTAFYGPNFDPPQRWRMVAHPVALVGEPTTARDRTGIAFDDGKLKVTAIEVNHSPADPAYGYRFDYQGRSIVISGDTVRHPPLARAARGADVLFHEAQPEHVVKMIETISGEAGDLRVSKNVHGIGALHTTPPDAAAIANDAKVTLLVFYHVTGALNVVGESVFARGVKEVRPTGWLVPRDGTMIELPLRSKEIKVSGAVQ
ncbi:MAG: MBL fold metallo-hydrolase [Acidobacteria bacterium]|nr:MBL fold metallo-hydrolase [Acidobacteriota bacterium]